ncbi:MULTISPECIES: ribonuclease J [Azorhizobium]|uniref:Putative hydrolase of the metallo-beta-lactamase superfamily n=1 Tax=Azorhizobium caulinodans (strain ATCC 43989 / DSM 5975 / JCM 20966 / LMG 6465 / NBRC 14845 / NCIMB 13405 / ORS 571) TaxID=438753 RepID=A8I428_AZOC5|nr:MULTISPECIES: ribonuclease J [Azorhizobium]TDT94696.1 ribonuclease J [Azorhizobium sp. AG788]BAF87681.1 putative hydrolase of the metallo-beta-lactamase superfamily [Azorhizobium caulinodans ORS 571]
MADNNELVFAPLGGVGEIGMNLGLYGIGPRKQRQWLIVDLGMSFAGEEAPGVDLVMPDIRFLESVKDRIAGLVLTHGHEDHVGAMLDLWPRIGCPVYTTRFTAALLDAKRLQEPGAPKIPIEVVRSGGRAQIGPFEVEFVPVAHSIPDSHALAIRTAAGLVLHTGDWKLDPTPVVGHVTDIARLQALGDEGVRAMICDSTNAIRDGVSPSEADVAATLRDVVAKAKYRVAFTTFSSNVARVRAIAEAAYANDREVVVVGRAMERVIGVAREQGMLDGLPAFRGADAFGFLPRDKVVAILTGSQGEPRAALSRIATDDHPEIALSHGDLVVFSSRTIPGNEKVVNTVINGLVKRGIKVMTDKDGLVHVSGHPRRGELEQMYKWVRPQVSVPVHGEPLHLTEHAALAKALGVPEVVSCADGHVIRLAPGHAERVEDVPYGRLYKDGRLLIPDSARTIPERRRLAYVGIVSVALAVDNRGNLVGDPSVEITGIPERGEGGIDFLDLILDTVVTTAEGLPKARRRDPDAMSDSIERAVRGAVNGAWGKKPVCHVHIVEV